MPPEILPGENEKLLEELRYFEIEVGASAPKIVKTLEREAVLSVGAAIDLIHQASRFDIEHGLAFLEGNFEK